MQTNGMLYRLSCISLGVERGCYIVVIKLPLEEGNLIIYNLVITFQSHAVREINNVRVSLGIKKQMAPPPGLLPLTFESLPLCILWVVSYITAQINDFGACRQQMSPLWLSVISIHVFNQRYIAIFNWILVIICDEVCTREVRWERNHAVVHDEKHLAVNQSSFILCSQVQSHTNAYSIEYKDESLLPQNIATVHTASHMAAFCCRLSITDLFHLSRGQGNQWACQEQSECYLPAHQVLNVCSDPSAHSQRISSACGSLRSRRRLRRHMRTKQ